MWTDERDARTKFNEQLEYITSLAPGYEPQICLTEGFNFRYEVDPTYKGNRKKVRKPMGFLAHKEWVKENTTTIIKPGIEADDTLGILMTKPGADNVLWSGDKDLKQIPGKHLSSEGIHEVSPDDADLWFLTQVLAGDPTDGYKGCPGIGMVKAAKLLSMAIDDCVKAPGTDGRIWQDHAWSTVVAAYGVAGLTEEDAIRQARLARILRWEDWNMKEQKVKLWTPTA